jgi:uncharacterized iron-regulated membrane protein
MSLLSKDVARDETPPDARAARHGGWALLRRLHFYAGIFIAPFLIVAALTGLVYAFTPQLDRLVYKDELKAEQVAGQPRPIEEQVAAARQAHPEGTVASVITPVEPDDTTQVVLSVPEELGGDLQRTVYVDPYTSEVTGALTTSWDSTPLTTWLDNLHGNLNLGDVGALYSETAASWLWILVLGGGVLWLGRARGQRARTVRGALLPDRTARGVRRTRSWHAATGLWLAGGLLFLSATGLTWSQHAGSRFEALLDSAGAHAPTLDTTLSSGTEASGNGHGGHGHHSGPEDSREEVGTPADPVTAIGAVLATARDAGLDGPVKLTPPQDAHSAWTVAQTDKTWPVRLDAAAVDPSTGEITARSDFAGYPLLAKLSKFGIQAHMGRLFGLANQIALAAIAVGLLFLIAFGYRMWWQRRPTRADRRARLGNPPARGAWRQLPKPVLFGGIPAVVALGWALPVFGVTLAGFLALDVIVGRIQQHRARAAAGAW